jgi:hypothetical protein
MPICLPPVSALVCTGKLLQHVPRQSTIQSINQSIQHTHTHTHTHTPCLPLNIVRSWNDVKCCVMMDSNRDALCDAACTHALNEPPKCSTITEAMLHGTCVHFKSRMSHGTNMRHAHNASVLCATLYRFQSPSVPCSALRASEHASHLLNERCEPWSRVSGRLLGTWHRSVECPPAPISSNINEPAIYQCGHHQTLLCLLAGCGGDMYYIDCSIDGGT